MGGQDTYDGPWVVYAALARAASWHRQGTRSVMWGDVQVPLSEIATIGLEEARDDADIYLILLLVGGGVRTAVIEFDTIFPDGTAHVDDRSRYEITFDHVAAIRGLGRAVTVRSIPDGIIWFAVRCGARELTRVPLRMTHGRPAAMWSATHQ